MTTTMWHDDQDEERPRFGPPIAWALAAAAIMSVFAIVAIIVNYARLNGVSEQRVEHTLPATTYDTVAALVRASGNACVRVCSVSAANSTLGADTELDVACQTQTAATCAAPHHFRISIATKTGPQR
jgi:hypothetical protein